MSRSLNSLTVSQIRNDSSHSLWVINNSARISNMEDGDIVFQITLNPGEFEVVQVPFTWVPIDIGSQFEKAVIVRSPNFMKAINSRSILAISEDDAQDILKDESARIEFDKVIAKIAGGSISDDLYLTKDKEENPIDEDFSKVHAKVYEIIKREEITENEQFTTITQLNNLGVIKDEEIRFILDNSPFDKVKTYITNNTRKRSR